MCSVVRLLTFMFRFLCGSRLPDEVCELAHHADFIQTPLPVLTMVMLVWDTVFLDGLLAEMQVRTYHDHRRGGLCGAGKNRI